MDSNPQRTATLAISILKLTALDVFEKLVYGLLLVYYMEYLIETLKVYRPLHVTYCDQSLA